MVYHIVVKHIKTEDKRIITQGVAYFRLTEWVHLFQLLIVTY